MISIVFLLTFITIYTNKIMFVAHDRAWKNVNNYGKITHFYFSSILGITIALKIMNTCIN